MKKKITFRSKITYYQDVEFDEDTYLVKLWIKKLPKELQNNGEPIYIYIPKKNVNTLKPITIYDGVYEIDCIIDSREVKAIRLTDLNDKKCVIL